MFIVNNEILSKKNTPELWTWYNKKIKEIEKSGKTHFNFTSFKFHHYEKDEYGKKIRMRRFKLIPTTSIFDNKELAESQTWTYVPSANSIKNENGIMTVINSRPFKISENEIYSVDKDIEIIFFLVYISEALYNKRIFLIDEEAENIKKVDEAAVAAEAQYLIFSPQSPINEKTLGTDEVYRQLAIAYGIPGSSTLHLAELKNKLWNTLSSSHRTKVNSKASYQQFINDCYNSTNSEMRSTILLAVERGVVYFDKGGWWIKIRGEYDELVVRVAPNEEINKKDILVNYLVQHKEYLSIVKEAIENTTKRLVNESIEIEEETDPEKMTRPQMVKKLIKLGLNNREVFGMATNEMRNRLKKAEKIEKVENVSE